MLVVLGAFVLCTQARVLRTDTNNLDLLKALKHEPFAEYGPPGGDFVVFCCCCTISTWADGQKCYFWPEATHRIFRQLDWWAEEWIHFCGLHMLDDRKKTFEDIPLAPLLPGIVSPDFVIDIEDQHEPAADYGLRECPSCCQHFSARSELNPHNVLLLAAETAHRHIPAPPAPDLPELPAPIRTVVDPIPIYGLRKNPVLIEFHGNWKNYCVTILLNPACATTESAPAKAAPAEPAPNEPASVYGPRECCLCASCQKKSSA